MDNIVLEIVADTPRTIHVLPSVEAETAYTILISDVPVEEETTEEEQSSMSSDELASHPKSIIASQTLPTNDSKI